MIEIKMRTPGGKPSRIRVDRTEKGVDLHFSRSTEGELLIRLPGYAARRLAEAIEAELIQAELVRI